MKHYPHHIGDFDKATRHLTRIERSIYRDLLDMYYDKECQISLDIPDVCRKILARSNDESTAVEQVLNEFFTETPTGWYNDKCEEVIADYRANNTQKSQAGKASAAKKALRKQQALNARSTVVGTLVGTDVEQTSNGTPTNQEPITNNQEPIKEKKKKKEPEPEFHIPDWVNASHWDAWHSGDGRKKATNAMKQVALDKLTAWRDAGMDHAGALENAAMGGYQGIFLPKTATQSSSDQLPAWRREEQERMRIAAPGVMPGQNVTEFFEMEARNVAAITLDQ